MRWYILRTLLIKEALRHLADRGAIFLSLILVAAIMLLTFFEKRDEPGGAGKGAGIRKVYFVDYAEDGPWIAHLRRNTPPELPVHFRDLGTIEKSAEGVLLYPPSAVAVQVRVLEDKDSQGRARYQIILWHPDKDAAALAPLAEWFWKETCRYYQNTPLRIDVADGARFPHPPQTLIEYQPSTSEEQKPTGSRYIFWPGTGDTSTAVEEWKKEAARIFRTPLEIELEQHAWKDPADDRSKISTGLVVFALCFFCVYLLPALTCEERERGVLLAQALSPASTLEILAAKFLFYPTMGIALAALISGIYRPAVLLLPLFWLSLVVTSLGYLGVGLTVASLAPTQRRASMGALCYLLTVSLLIFISTQNGIPFLPYFFFEFHVPRMLNAAFVGKRGLEPWLSLMATLVLAIGWLILAARLFRKRGWQ